MIPEIQDFSCGFFPLSLVSKPINVPENLYIIQKDLREG